MRRDGCGRTGGGDELEDAAAGEVRFLHDGDDEELDVTAFHLGKNVFRRAPSESHDRESEVFIRIGR